MTDLQKAEEYLKDSRITEEIRNSDIIDPKSAFMTYVETLTQECLGLKAGGCQDNSFDYGFMTGLAYSRKVFECIFKNFKPEWIKNTEEKLKGDYSSFIQGVVLEESSENKWNNLDVE